MVPLVSMAENEALKRYIEAGIAFTEATRARAEEFVKDLARSGEIQWDQVQSQVDELVDWSKRNTDELLGTIRDEVAAPLSLLSQTTKDRLEAWERRFEETFKDGFAIMATWRRAHREEPSEEGTETPEDPGDGITAVVDGPEGYEAPPAVTTPGSVDDGAPGPRLRGHGRECTGQEGADEASSGQEGAGCELPGFAGGSDGPGDGARRRQPRRRRPRRRRLLQPRRQEDAAKKTAAKKTAAKKVPAAKAAPAKKATAAETSRAPSTDGPSSAASGPASGDRKE